MLGTKHKNALKTWWERILKKCGTTKHEGERKQKNEPLKNKKTKKRIWKTWRKAKEKIGKPSGLKTKTNLKTMTKQ